MKNQLLHFLTSLSSLFPDKFLSGYFTSKSRKKRDFPAKISFFILQLFSIYHPFKITLKKGIYSKIRNNLIRNHLQFTENSYLCTYYLK